MKKFIRYMGEKINAFHLYLDNHRMARYMLFITLFTIMGGICYFRWDLVNAGAACVARDLGLTVYSKEEFIQKYLMEMTEVDRNEFIRLYLTK